jgi:N-acetylglutamate synthase-like GNAT family acetyltransferase
MVDFAVEESAAQNRNRIVALTTQSSAFFRESCGFTQGQLSHLPKRLRESTKRSGRNSQVLYKDL